MFSSLLDMMLDLCSSLWVAFLLFFNVAQGGAYMDHVTHDAWCSNAPTYITPAGFQLCTSARSSRSEKKFQPSEQTSRQFPSSDTLKPHDVFASFVFEFLKFISRSGSFLAFRDASGPFGEQACRVR